ncbi:MAG: class I SAM-dependent methyltransferase [Planctomycetaceae bacterium]|jgi:23S rRNA (cytosine1962-C5)-methyltransferase|nr:class I SAM-dependent methyltransferase [Planctomycetaceae bacterium]
MDYELIDFGNGRRLERFGTLVLDRPCPAADNRQRKPVLWHKADARFDGKWSTSVPKQIVDFGAVRLEIRCTPSGHVGVFPEQILNWNKLAAVRYNSGQGNIRILNLFAYSGGSSIAAAQSAPFAEVVHVDSAKGIVDRAKHNAALNGIHSIRFIVEDVRKFVKRELKRECRYDAVILDPPSYGHGVKGEAWKIAADLPPLLEDIARLLNERPAFLLLTAHTEGLDTAALQTMLQRAKIDQKTEFTASEFLMNIPSSGGGKLGCGCGVWCGRISS